MSLLGKPRDERGAVAPFVAVLVVLLVGLASFAVDLGYQRVAARDMQAVADIVAMDMARELDGTKGNVLKNTDRWQDAVRGSLARNDDAAVGDKLKVVSCNYNSDTLPNGQAVLCATPGVYDPVSRTFSSGGNAPATHVRVLTRTRVDYFFPIYADEGWVTKTAYASATSSACFRLGSFALGLNSENSSLLNALIGDALNLGALGYDGLASAEVSLIGLAAELDVGTVDELLALPDLSLGQLALAAADVLRREGGDTAVISLLSTIGTSVGELPPIDLGEIIEVSPGSDAALNAGLNVLDLIAASAFLANGDNLLDVPDLTVGLDGIASITTTLKVIAAPQVACGEVDEAKARNSQVLLDIDVNLLDVPLGLPPLASVKAATSLKLTARLGDARGTLQGIRCSNGAGAAEGVDVSVATALTQISLALRTDLSARVLGIRVPVAEVSAGVGTLEGPETHHAEINVPPHTYSTPVETGTGEVGLSGLTVDDLSVNPLGLGGLGLGSLLNGLLSGLLTPIVNPLIGVLDRALLGPLSELLGLNIAGADVFIGDGRLDPPTRPTCSSPALRG